MENQINVVEQPKSIDTSQSLIVNNLIEEGENVIDNDGSTQIGKFKSVEALYDAYKNLQAEFTRKSQKLSTLIKSDNLLNVKDKNNTPNNEDTNILDIDSDNDALLTDNGSTMQSIENDSSTVTDNKPQYASSTWNEQVVEFFKTHNYAQDFSAEIASMLVKDKNLASMPNSLSLAYDRVLAEKFKPKHELINDDEFINNYILNSEKIKKMIINEYLLQINTQKSPKLMTSSIGGGVGIINKDKPQNLDDAKRLVELMLKNK